MPSKNTYPSVGWREWVVLPDFANAKVKAKIDTGARTSAIHAVNIQISSQLDQDVARFDIHPDQDDDTKVVHCVAPCIGQRTVTNSGGQDEERYIVTTRVQLGSRVWSIELSLTDRDSMGFRMLLGRTALRGRFVVDPGRSFLQSPALPSQ